MKSHKYKHVRAKALSSETNHTEDHRTRNRLIEAAGRLIAEKGVDRVTGKEICAAAKVNAASINYHFGGFQGLYVAVLCEAHHRLATIEDLQAAIARADTLQAKLEAVFGIFAKAITGPISSTWVVKVLGREVVGHSEAFAVMKEKEALPKFSVVRPIVAEIMGLPEEHPAVARGCVSTFSPCFMLLIGNRYKLKQMHPALGLGPEDRDPLIRHLTQFALAGLAAVAKDFHSEHAVKKH